ncbi:isoaspartyl peptidase/L-asparaginase family protein [Psychroflexus planctonicus]|uniref:Isoaspartyl peptidase/L-asparaginase n=1 Tax=Psychroflexus planctonicus TaxID=1526575 RepID=A0ABQ1SCK7_9FLAO|nr:isoaspartyl peptidase/L-asparaginase [Psychroflexus planctonicus]GGE25335.1 isoaspartyl peptidase/L-asparaginase [Psychroflexus planctonicus]
MKTCYVFLISLFLFSCVEEREGIQQKVENQKEAVEKARASQQAQFGIALHGGAGVIKKEFMSDSMQTVYENKLEEAIRVGHEILANGGKAEEAVMKTINILEDSPLFNSGRGAVFSADGVNELDASIMHGGTLNAGAIAGVTTVKNPINLAFEVMENSPHVLLSGKGAETFAQMQGLELVENEYFHTESKKASLRRSQANDNGKTSLYFKDELIQNDKYGTVGCVALDQDGNLVAGTSTGGMTNKKYGRIGDSPIIGAGNYANNATCAVSATGHGEFFIRNVVAYDISALMEYQNLSLEQASKIVIQEKLGNLGGSGGIVAIDHLGNVVMEFNTPGMFRAQMNEQGELKIGMYKED